MGELGTCWRSSWVWGALRGGRRSRWWRIHDAPQQLHCLRSKCYYLTDALFVFLESNTVDFQGASPWQFFWFWDCFLHKLSLMFEPHVDCKVDFELWASDILWQDDLGLILWSLASVRSWPNRSSLVHLLQISWNTVGVANRHDGLVELCSPPDQPAGELLQGYMVQVHQNK